MIKGSVSKTFRPYDPTQPFLLPPSPLEWLPEGHLAQFILDTVGELDLSTILAHYERELRGKPPHHPRMMVALLVYGYCVGVASSRKIEKKTHEDVAFRVLAGNTHPDHVQISEFRRIHLKTLSGLFVQVLLLCRQMKMVKLGHVALDGTKMKANASKHKAMSYDRMNQDERRAQRPPQAAKNRHPGEFSIEEPLVAAAAVVAFSSSRRGARRRRGRRTRSAA